MPQTFSPHTRLMPVMAAPTAKCSQLARAISVEPRAPVKMGMVCFTWLAVPKLVSVLTAGKVAMSGLGSQPAAPRA